jgi:PhnB protein
MAAQISPMLAVEEPRAAMDFYQRAFDAAEVWTLGDPDPIVGCMSIEGAELFLAKESPTLGERSTRSPVAAGFTTVRIELFVDDPHQVHRHAVDAGARNVGDVEEHRHSMTGARPISRMLQGAVIDPSGHLWLIGKVLE